MNWNNILGQWENGHPFNYPLRLKNRFHWNTSPIMNQGHCKYKQKFKINHQLPKEQNNHAFIKYILKSKHKYAVSFLNLSKDTMLVIPMPRADKNYATLKDFVDNASPNQQKEFWKFVSQTIRKCMKKHDTLWVSTHGLGVPYLHIRISTQPKYYFAKSKSYL